MHQYDAGDIRDDTGALFYRARTAPEGGEGNHVCSVRVKGEGPNIPQRGKRKDLGVEVQ